MNDINTAATGVSTHRLPLQQRENRSVMKYLQSMKRFQTRENEIRLPIPTRPPHVRPDRGYVSAGHMWPETVNRETQLHDKLLRVWEQGSGFRAQGARFGDHVSSFRV